MLSIKGECNWNVLSTPSPEEIFLTIKEEFKPLFLLAITMPSKTWIRFLFPSTTFTPTATVSPTSNLGIDLPSFAISSFSSVLIISTIIHFPFYLFSLVPALLQSL